VLTLDLEVQIQVATPRGHRAPDRCFMAHLFGNMADYSWGIAGNPVIVREGERIEIEIMNMSMMSHPMHLHGHHFQVVDIGQGRFAGPMRDTVIVPPMGMVTVAVDLDKAGGWFLHCHHLYHMAGGMMGVLTVA